MTEILSVVFYERILPNGAAGAVFVLLILMFRSVTKHWSKGYVRLLWLLLIAELMAPPLFHGSVNTFRNFNINAENTPQVQKTSRFGSGADGKNKNTALAAAEGTEADAMHSPAETEAAGRNESRSRQESSAPGMMRKLRAWGAGIWAAGFLAVSAVYLYQFFWLKKKMSQACYLPEQDCWESPQTGTPFVMPGIRPKIYLPKGLGSVQQEDILAHERQHIKNLDPFVKIAAACTGAVYWFHPLVWAAVLLMGKDMEMYCDECVMRGKSMQERKRYSYTLLEFASKSSGLALTMNFGESSAEHRIRHILGMKRPHKIISLLLILFIGISGVFFLTSKKQAASAENRQAEMLADPYEQLTADRQAQQLPQDDFRQDQKRFAEEVIRLTADGDKEELARLISFPIRADVNGEETNISGAREFVDHYDEIANDEWKARVQNADAENLMENSMGTAIGDGCIWFAAVSGQEGYFITAINNAHVQPLEEEGAKERWLRLAQEAGMAEAEAQSWYARFENDGIHVDTSHYQITGCIYRDLNGNGKKELFFVSSINPHAVYPETLDHTMYVYGYINEKLAYEQGFEAFSQDGFLQFDSKPAQDAQTYRIRYTVDTDSIKETPYELDIDAQGNILDQESGETREITDVMTKFYLAYFAGDAETLKKYLSESYQGEPELYWNPQHADEAEIIGIKGLDDIGQKEISECRLSLEFREPGEDSYTYLSVGFQKENGAWKVSDYGMEK